MVLILVLGSAGEDCAWPNIAWVCKFLTSSCLLQRCVDHVYATLIIFRLKSA